MHFAIISVGLVFKFGIVQYYNEFLKMVLAVIINLACGDVDMSRYGGNWACDTASRCQRGTNKNGRVPAILSQSSFQPLEIIGTHLAA
jgi:hypothetical protein